MRTDDGKMHRLNEKMCGETVRMAHPYCVRTLRLRCSPYHRNFSWEAGLSVEILVEVSLKYYTSGLYSSQVRSILKVPSC